MPGKSRLDTQALTGIGIYLIKIVILVLNNEWNFNS